MAKISKNTIAIIAFVITLTIFIGAFSSSYSYQNMSNLAYVLAIGIDKGEKAKMKISLQFTNSSSFSSQNSSSEDSRNIVLVSGEADSIFSGINLLNSYIGKEINLSHCNLVVFSEEFAKNGISSQIYSLLNNEKFRPTTNLIISNCNAYEYLKNIKPNLEKLTTNYYDTFSLTNKFTGYFSNITVGEFFNTLSKSNCDGTAILGGLNANNRTEKTSSESSNEGDSENSNSSNDSSSSGSLETSSQSENVNVSNTITNSEELTAGTSSIQGKRGTENIGIAVFDDDKMCGKLNALETMCHLLLKNEIKTCIISINNPYPSMNKEKIELSLVPTRKSKIYVEIKDDIPYIYIDLNLKASIITLEDNLDYDNNEVLKTFSYTATDYLKNSYKDYFSKLKNYGIDIDCFSNKALSHFSTNQEWEKFNWPEKLKSAVIEVNPNINVTSSILITRT